MISVLQRREPRPRQVVTFPKVSSDEGAVPRPGVRSPSPASVYSVNLGEQREQLSVI